MRTRSLLVPLLVPAALGLVAGCGSSDSKATTTAATPSAAASSSAASTSVASGGPLMLVERPTASTFTPKGGRTVQGEPTRRPGPGDVSAFDAELTRSGAPAGHDHVSFTYQNDGDALVSATLTLSDGTLGDGTIVARGTAPVVDTITLPVVSGAGAYAGRTGTLTAKHVNGEEDDLTIVLH